MRGQGKSVLERLKARFPGAAIALTEFPSGAFMIDVPRGSETFVVELLTKEADLLCCGWLHNAVFGFEGCEETYRTVEQLEDRLAALLV